MLSKRESEGGIIAGYFREPHPSGAVGAQKGTLFFPNLAFGSGLHTGSVWFVPLPGLRELAVGGLARHLTSQEHAWASPWCRHERPVCLSI